MRLSHVILIAACLLAGCTSTRHSASGNRDYARNCGMAMDELGMCNGYLSPHEF